MGATDSNWMLSLVEVREYSTRRSVKVAPDKLPVRVDPIVLSGPLVDKIGPVW